RRAISCFVVGGEQDTHRAAFEVRDELGSGTRAARSFVTEHLFEQPDRIGHAKNTVQRRISKRYRHARHSFILSAPAGYAATSCFLPIKVYTRAPIAFTVAAANGSRRAKGVAMPTLKSPGLEMHYEGDDFTAPWTNPETILMLHGNCESGAAWYGWVPHLAPHYRLVRPDMRGFGRSTPMPRDFPWTLDTL